MYSAMGFYHCANIPASTVPFHVPRSHGSALRFRSFRLRFIAQAAAVLPLSPGTLNSASQPKQLRFCLSVPAITTLPHSPSSCGSASQSRQSQLCLTAQAVTVPAFCLTVPAVSTLPHNPSSHSPGTLNSALRLKQLQSKHSASQSRQSQFGLTARYR